MAFRLLERISRDISLQGSTHMKRVHTPHETHTHSKSRAHLSVSSGLLLQSRTSFDRTLQILDCETPDAMKKSAGPITIIDTNPPYRAWDGNQATYLFFPVFASALLVLLAVLSSPIIHGLGVLDIDTHGNGTVSLGAWGWCARGVPNVTSVVFLIGRVTKHADGFLGDLAISARSTGRLGPRWSLNCRAYPTHSRRSPISPPRFRNRT